MRLIGASSSTTRIAASATRPSCRHQREIRLQRGEVEAVRRFALFEEVLRKDAVGLVAVAVPELPRHLLEAAPRYDRQAPRVVGDDVDGVAAPRARLRVAGQ